MTREQLVQMALDAGGRMYSSDEVDFFIHDLEKFAALVAAAALAEPVQGCPSCEYNKQRAQLWRHEAYKLGGHPLDWEPELMVRPKPLTDEEIRSYTCECVDDGTFNMACAIDFARAIERAHGIGAPPCATGDCIPSKCNICKVKE